MNSTPAHLQDIDDGPEYDICILCGEPEYDDCDDICYCCGYKEEPEEGNE